MYAKRLKSDLVELCKQRGLCIGRLTKEQLIARLEAEDRANELIPVSQGSSLANAAQAPVSVPAGSGQPAAEGFLRPLLPMPRGRVGRSPANTEGAVTLPASRGSSKRRSASVERNWLEWEKELKLRELEDREQERQHEREEKERQRQHEERQRQHEREENERQRQHEERQRQENERQRQHDLELARLKGSEPPAAVSEGGPRTARSFDKCILAPRKEGEDMDDFLEAFETACELHRVDPADRLRVLTPLLDPKAVALYRQLEEAEKGDYELFKKALLREFGLTPEMYRERFRSQDKTPEISYLQLAARMEGYASKWADGAQTKEDLIKLLVLEKLYERCPSDLRLWLVDRKPENPRHAGRLADEFVKSRSGDKREESQRSSPTTTQRESHHGTSPWENITIWCQGQHQGVQFVLNKERRRFQTVDSDRSEAVFPISNMRREDGADVTIRCQGQRRDVRFFLHKTGDLNLQRHMDPAGDGAEFHIPTVGRQHGGSYSCSYRPRPEPFISSEPSNTVELVIAGQEYPKPPIRVSPSRVVALGGSVTIRCESWYPGMEFFLRKAGHPNPQVRTVPDGTVAEFPIPSVSREDGGSYTCDYRSITDQNRWSYPSDPVEIIVAGGSESLASPGLTSPIIAGVSVVAAVLLLLLVAFVCFRKTRARKGAAPRPSR
ncbi:uncharacterized protein LOC135976427 [Chrysemys picta bellii]|uniref:uncharacterized protein LOC135976427 n=1 Tax=Chrysemys picta bellii TaxID=8478 RepID=UPI0032B28043